jgi:hypothetical protein
MPVASGSGVLIWLRIICLSLAFMILPLILKKLDFLKA